jgi:hypothetical protein
VKDLDMTKPCFSAGWILVAAGFAGCSRLPTELELVDRVLSTDEVIVAGREVHLETAILNPRRHNIQIDSVRSSCGCTEIKVAGSNISPTTPIVSAEERIPVHIVVNTQAKIGRAVYDIAITCSSPEFDASQELAARIELNVLRGLMVAPRSLAFSEDDLGTSHVVTLTTDLPGEFPAIKYIRVPEPTCFKASLLPITGPATGERQIAIEFLHKPIGREFPSYYQATIVPDDDTIVPVSIPIRIDAARPSLSVSPTQLTLATSESDTHLTRRVTLTATQPLQQFPQAEYPPALCRITFERGDTPEQVFALIEFRPDAVGKQFSIQFRTATGAMELPVILLAVRPSRELP